MRCFVGSSPACSTNQSMTGRSTGMPRWIRSRSAGVKVRINPLSCLAAFSMAPFACGSYAGGDSST
eukprot:4959768-Alexandrium_andersonii.AAC.1